MGNYVVTYKRKGIRKAFPRVFKTRKSASNAIKKVRKGFSRKEISRSPYKNLRIKKV